jgi:hypothetical protein
MTQSIILISIRQQLASHAKADNKAKFVVNTIRLKAKSERLTQKFQSMTSQLATH